MLYEFRIYYANPGRLPEVQTRLKDHAMRIFPKHGIKVIDYFTAANDGEELYYICEFTDMEARNKAWTGFEEDPEWLEIKAESHKNGILLKSVTSCLMERLTIPKFDSEKA
jgi:hypothetical protein